MAGVPWYFDDACRAYRVRPGFKFPIVEMSKSSMIADARSNSELLPIVKQLIANGETFMESLRTFQEILEGG